MSCGLFCSWRCWRTGRVRCRFDGWWCFCCSGCIGRRSWRQPVCFVGLIEFSSIHHDDTHYITATYNVLDNREPKCRIESRSYGQTNIVTFLRLIDNVLAEIVFNTLRHSPCMDYEHGKICWGELELSTLLTYYRTNSTKCVVLTK